VLLSGLLGCGIAVVFKRHMEAAPEAVQTVEVVGDIAGKRALIWDDMILGGSTLVNAADMVLERGARSVHACITHPVLCGDAAKRIEESNLAELIVTDSIPLPENLESTKITTISISSLLGDAIARISRNDSVSELL